MQPKIQQPLIASETILPQKDITSMSDEQIEQELFKVGPRLVQTKQAFDTAQKNHQQMQNYAQQLMTAAIERQLQAPDGYQSTQTTSVIILGGPDSIESIFRNYRGYLKNTIQIDGEKFAQELQHLIRDDELLIDIPAKLERKQVLSFDYDLLGTLPTPELVIEPVMVHDPLRREKTNENPEGKA